jgi:plastocyanin
VGTKEETMDTRWQQGWRQFAGWSGGLLVVGLLLAGCGGSSAAALSPTSTATATATAAPTATATSVPTATPNSSPATVRIAGDYYGQLSFSPATITIAVGTTLVWTNSTTVAHTSTSDAGSAVSWDSGMINPGATFSFTFTRAGTFTYHCNVHPYMHGTVVVTA